MCELRHMHHVCPTHHEPRHQLQSHTRLFFLEQTEEIPHWSQGKDLLPA